MILFIGFLFDKCSDSMLLYCFVIEKMHWFIIYFRDKVLNNSVQLLCNRCQKWKQEISWKLELLNSSLVLQIYRLHFYSFRFFPSAIFFPFHFIFIFRESIPLRSIWSAFFVYSMKIVHEKKRIQPFILYHFNPSRNWSAANFQ